MMVADIKGADRSRFVADRFRRIWHIVEHIAANPGHSRRELAETFHLSERQVQADLNIVRCDMRLPLIRRQGYRFVAEGATGSVSTTMTLQDGQRLVAVLRHARANRVLSQDALDDLTRKLLAVTPPHIYPLLSLLTATLQKANGRWSAIIGPITDAILGESWVRLYYPRHDYANMPACGAEPVIRPEMLIPYLDSWYVVGFLAARSRTVMLKLDAVRAVHAVTAVEAKKADHAL